MIKNSTCWLAVALVSSIAGCGETAGNFSNPNGAGNGAIGVAGSGGGAITSMGGVGASGAPTNAAGTSNQAGAGGAGPMGGAGTGGLGMGGLPAVAGGGGEGGMQAVAGAGGMMPTAGANTGGTGVSLEDLEPFSFFVTSQAALIALAPDENGFGGDLRFGEATGLAGADKICTTIAEQSMPGSSIKIWRAFLSTTAGGENDGPVHAITRIGTGPWYDFNGRLIANNVEGLLGTRPDGDPQAVLDLANELGEPNHSPGGIEVDNHDTLTGSNTEGRLMSDNIEDTCGDWTRNDAPLGRPRIGHSWPRNAGNLDNGGQWASEHEAQGCLAKVNTESDGGGPDGCGGVGCGGGYGGLYCFALNP